MDTEIGRLLDNMDPDTLADTIVIFVGDNGTDKPATTAPFLPDHAKGTLYEGGVHVPLIIAGPGIPAGAECAALVAAVDLFATIADIAGVPHSTGTDSVSMVPYLLNPALPSLRAYNYTEYFQPNGQGPYTTRQRAARDARFKLIWFYDHSDTPNVKEFYDLQADPLEQVNLLPGPLPPLAQASLDALVAALTEQTLMWADYGHALAGSAGVPKLEGSGLLLPGEQVALTLQGGKPGGTAALIIGTSYILAGFKGGVMVPMPQIVAPGLLLDGTGGLVIAGEWPSGIPANFNLYYQVWINDPANPKGYAASNAVRSTSP
jgi:hypothetical protein